MVCTAPVTDDRPTPPDEGMPPEPGMGTDALTMIVQLQRASSVTATRLQLALSRGDRRQAMAALDYLLDIDAEIERLGGVLAPARADDPDWQAILSYLTAQRQAIAAEKHALAGEIERAEARPQGIAHDTPAPAGVSVMATAGEPARGFLGSQTGVLLVLLLVMVGVVAVLAGGLI